MDLTVTGLNQFLVKEIGNALRKARSLICIHLSGNQGIADLETKQWLVDRIKCRPNEDIERFTRIRDKIMNLMKDQPANMLDGIKSRITREIDMRIKTDMNNPITPNDQLVFQRVLGHKNDMPGSGMWYESSNAVACPPHYKNNCWICDGHVYSVIFWSKGMAYKLDPLFDKKQSEIVRFEIDRDFGEDEEDDLIYCNGSVDYKKLEN